MKEALPSRFEQALHFINTNGRDLDRALAGYYFGDIPLPVVLAALGIHANADGGFGNGLEPDFLLPASSPMATSIGLQILAELDVRADAPLVEGALDYLAKACAKAGDTSLGVWHSAPASVNDHPHAPWWHQNDEPPVADALRFNPGPELIGYFLRWPQSGDVPVQAWLDDMMQHLMEADALEAHAFLCFARLANQPNMPPQHRDDLTACLQAHLPDNVETDPEKWGPYCIKPLTAAPRPNALLAPQLTASIEAQIPYELARQGNDGAWRPHWTWGDSYPDIWAKVEPQIAASLTLTMLRDLCAWGARNQLDAAMPATE